VLTTAHITQYCLEPNPSQAGLLGERWQPAALQSPPPPSQDKSSQVKTSQVKSSQVKTQVKTQVKSSQAKPRTTLRPRNAPLCPHPSPYKRRQTGSTAPCDNPSSTIFTVPDRCPLFLISAYATPIPTTTILCVKAGRNAPLAHPRSPSVPSPAYIRCHWPSVPPPVQLEL
jgi:hypothetical protein